MLNPDKYKKRLMYCNRCKGDIEAEGIAPKCPACLSSLINIMYNPLTGQRITGVIKYEQFKFGDEK